jgi:hypothetical protein
MPDVRVLDDVAGGARGDDPRHQRRRGPRLPPALHRREPPPGRLRPRLPRRGAAAVGALDRSARQRQQVTGHAWCAGRT